jgi:hypothetical protein
MPQTLTKSQFNALVEDLLKKVENLSYDDYYGGMRLVDEFERLAHDNIAFLDYLVTSETHGIRADFENMKRYKKSATKSQHFESAVSGLRHDVASMKRNKFPE